MDRRVEPTVDAASAGKAGQSDDTPIFRAVSTPSQRRGIRLEAIYWTILKKIARLDKRPLGAVVEAIANRGDAANGSLASLLRVHVARRLLDRVGQLEHLARADIARAIIQASPSP